MVKIAKKRKIQPAKEESSSDTEFQDSDEELQDAFAKGTLQPGLVAEVPIVREKKEYPNNVPIMKLRLNEIMLNEDWIERLDIVTTKSDEDKAVLEDATIDLTTDDLQREMLFYRQAQTAVMMGLRRLHQLNIPTKRPEDYFAQMAKTDEHMLKIKRHALEKQLGQERSQKVAKLRDLRKFGKKVQVQVQLDRSKKKREMMDKLKEYKQGKLKNLDFLDEDDRPKRGTALEKTKEEVKKRNAKKNKFQGNKASRKDEKFGFGGKKRDMKRNGTEIKGKTGGGKFKAGAKGGGGKFKGQPNSGGRGGKPKGMSKKGGGKGKR